ncbi:MAG: cytochrome c [Candidatus Acidiferrales bacterium]
MKNPVAATPQAIVAGKKTYDEHCLKCHGDKGDGRGEKAESLRVAPSDFTDSHKMSEPTDGELFWRISEGHLPMPPFKNKLSEAERWELVDYIRTFSTKLVAAPPDSSTPALPDLKK